MSREYRIGLLVPSSNTTVEPEFYRALPPDVTLHCARMFLQQITTDSIQRTAEDVERESRGLASADVDVVVLGATAPSFINGLGYDREMCARIEGACGKPAVTTSSGLIEALQELGIHRISLGSAYTDTVNGICANFLRSNELEVVTLEGLGLEDNLVVGRLTAETAYAMGRRIDRPESQAIVLACTNWRSMDIIDRLEQDLGKPVLSTTQVSIWAALRRIGYPDNVSGYGQLLAKYVSMPGVTSR
ncbi:MAG: maleate cis-trans isomerase [Chloroflexota bacterium]